MVNAQNFVETKAFQLSNYADAMLNGFLPDSEVNLYCWDTLEEWSQIKSCSSALSHVESAFWYLLHQITFWNAGELRGCPNRKSEVSSCINFLRGQGSYPQCCCGVRP